MFKQKLTEVLGIVSPLTVAEMFDPKFDVDKNFQDGYILLKSDELGFRLKVSSSDDVSHVIEASLNQEAVSRIKERCMNSRKEFGEVEGNMWRQEIEVNQDLEVDYGKTESLESYRQTAKSIFQSSVNPVYSKKIAKKVGK
jgi:hypothetical protein